MIKQLLLQPLKLKAARRIDVDVPRFTVFATLMALLWLASRTLNIEGVPALHVEVLLLAPFMRSKTGLTLAIFSVLVATARIVQGLFGFEQIFVAANLLLRNFSDFPVAYTITVVACFALYVGLIIMLFNRLPVRTWSVPALVIIPVAAGVAAGKIAEDFAKQNIVGSSYGFFIGQLRFADMFNRAYRTPGARPTEYPGPIGAKLALASRLNYWLIVVESMGKPNADSLSAEMLSSFASDRLKRKYDISTGAVPSLGSTIHGEIRELCDGVLSDGLFGSANSHCVPSMLARNGYFTRAVHANGSTVYGRDVWYPKIGFAKISASDTEEALRGERSRRWGTKLDGDTIAWTASHAFEHRPSFTYLLTVSTHLPASSLPGTSPSEACLAKSTPHACTHLANLRQVLGQVASAAQDLDDTIVVVVGDHPPPFVSSSSREAFSRTDVPWVMLMPRAQ